RPYTKPILTPKGSRGGEYHVRRIDDSAGGSSATLDLHDRWRDGRDGIGKLVRNVSQLHICTQVTSSCTLMKHPLCLHDAASGEAIASPKRAANLRSAGLMSDFPPLPRLRWIRHSFSGTVGTSARIPNPESRGIVAQRRCHSRFPRGSKKESSTCSRT